MKKSGNIPADRFIDKSTECNLIQFRKCQFYEDYDCLIISGNPSKAALQNAFLNIYMEYLDTSGIAYDSTEKFLMKRELQLEIRQTVIKYSLFAQDIHLKSYNEPAFRGFPILEQHGCQLEWHNDVDDFNRQLDVIRNSQMSYDVDLFEVKEQLKNFRASKKANPQGPNDSEEKFYEMITALERFNFKIDQEKTSVMHLAVMIKSYLKMTDKNNHSKN